MGATCGDFSSARALGFVASLQNARADIERWLCVLSWLVRAGILFACLLVIVRAVLASAIGVVILVSGFCIRACVGVGICIGARIIVRVAGLAIVVAAVAIVVIAIVVVSGGVAACTAPAFVC